MGLEMVRNLVRVSARICFRSVGRHPFLVGLVFLLIFMYRSFPFLFSLLVSASPVIVSTAVLLATLLSFGQPNLPEIDKGEPVSTAITTTTTTSSRKSLKSTAFLGSDTVIVANDRSFDDDSERYYTKQEYELEHEHEKQEEVVSSSVIHKEASSDINNSSGDEGASITKESFQERVTEDTPVESFSRGFELKNIDYLDGETPTGRKILDNHYSHIQHTDDEEDDTELEKDKLPGDSMGSMETHGGSSWKSVDQGADDDGDEEDDEASDSGSDGAESSSPDASMADIIPMLDELHPLLDEEAPQPATLSHDGSDAASEHSLESSESNASEDDITNHEEFEVGEDDDEEEEEAHADKEDETKSAITWTEDDQKNLMNLGTSELERNQRLENLIARRRARKNLRLMAEKNLIDLESADLPFNIAPISTARNNPFDLPYDSNDNIPGSAPSILLPRRNPFDLPYDSSEEKPDLLGDTFQQDFVPLHQPREPFFRRHESFNVGPSIFGAPRQERQEIKLRPYFLPERMAMEGTSYSSFQRQSSEVSESKMSSVPDTESGGSAGDLEDMVIEEDLSQGAVLMTEHTSDLVGHGSQSSDDEETVELGQVENRDLKLDTIEVGLRDLEDHLEVESSSSESEGAATPTDLDINEMHLDTAVEEKHSNRSTCSSISEINEEIIAEKHGEALSSLEQNSSYSHVDPSISVQSLTDKPETNLTSLVMEESQHKEPVYDSSPPAVRKNLSSSSFSTELQGEMSEMGLSTVLVNKSDSFAEIESEASNQGIEKENTGSEEVSVNSSEQEEIAESELGSLSLPEISKRHVQESESIRDKEVRQVTPQFEQGEVPSWSSDVNLHKDIHEIADDKPVSAHNFVSGEKIAPHPEKELPLPERSVDESSSGIPDMQLVEVQDKLNTPNMDLSEIQAMDYKAPQNINFTSSPEPTIFQFDASVTEEPPTSADLSDVDEFGNSNLIRGLVHHNFSLLSTELHVDVPNNIEDVDEFKEIDENLLLELDTVGDFSVKDMGTNLDGMTSHMFADGDSIFEERDLENKSYGAITVNSIEKLETEVKVVAEDQLEDISHKWDTGTSELQNPRTDSAKRSVEVDLPRNIESSVSESVVKESTTATTAMPNLEVGSSLLEGSSLRVTEVKADEGKSPKSSSSSSSSSSSDSDKE